MTKNKVCGDRKNAPTKQWDQRNTYSFKYRKPYQDHSDSTRLRSIFWMKNKADKHVRGLEDMAPNPEWFCFGHGQKNVKKIARKALANLDVRLKLPRNQLCMPGFQQTSCQPLSEKITSPKPSQSTPRNSRRTHSSMLCLWGCGSRGCISLEIVTKGYNGILSFTSVTSDSKWSVYHSIVLRSSRNTYYFHIKLRTTIERIQTFFWVSAEGPAIAWDLPISSDQKWCQQALWNTRNTLESYKTWISDPW